MIILVGVAYGVIGIGVAALSDPKHFLLWRMAAWVISAALYAAHIGYEHYGLKSAPRATALHVAGAVALGAFAVALAANVHSLFAATHGQQPRLVLALVAFPVITAIPAFLVAFAVAAALARWWRRA